MRGTGGLARSGSATRIASIRRRTIISRPALSDWQQALYSKSTHLIHSRGAFMICRIIWRNILRVGAPSGSIECVRRSPPRDLAGSTPTDASCAPRPCRRPESARRSPAPGRPAKDRQPRDPDRARPVVTHQHLAQGHGTGRAPPPTGMSAGVRTTPASAGATKSRVACPVSRAGPPPAGDTAQGPPCQVRRGWLREASKPSRPHDVVTPCPPPQTCATRACPNRAEARTDHAPVFPKRASPALARLPHPQSPRKPAFRPAGLGNWPPRAPPAALPLAPRPARRRRPRAGPGGRRAAPRPSGPR